jgi:hypothetical protein
MSSFLVNLARRGAGLPATTIQAPPPSPFGPEIRKQGDGLAEELATGNTASQAPLRTSSSEEPTELPSEAPTHHTPSIQRLPGAVPGTLIQPSIGEPAATTRTPSLGPTPASRRHVIPPTFHAEREVITEIEVERGRHTPSPVAQMIEPTSSVASAPSIMIREPGEGQIVEPVELSAEWPRDRAQKTHEPALPAPTIRPGLADSHTFLQFPKVTPTSSPTPPSQLPIHVRIGRVEVRATTAPTPTPARPSPPASLGFDSYYRMRNYRS